jgi:uncharacterized protein YbcI
VPAHAAEHDPGSVLASISNAMVGLHRDHFGRGATKARTIVQGDWVVCLLEGVFTVEERLLISRERFATVRESRMAVQDEMREASVAKIEELTGRTVLASFSQVNREPELALEMFVLEPVSHS